MLILGQSFIEKRAKKAKKAKKVKKEAVIRESMKKKNGMFYPCVIKMNIYTGYRWKIPPGLKVSKTVRDKFQSVETFAPSMIYAAIKKKLVEPVFYIRPAIDMLGNTVESNWVPPNSVIESLKSHYASEQHEWKIVRSIYLKIFRLGNSLVKLFHASRVYKSLRNTKNTEDPVTLEIPKKPVKIIDYPKRISYVFEASTLRKTVESRIILSDYMFPNPLPPINPFTNAPYSRGQLLYIIQQCKAHGEYNWIFDRLLDCEADVNLFCLRFRQPLKILAIENHFKGCIHKYKDEVLDFFQIEADREDLPLDKVDSFIKRIDYRPNCSFVKQWVILTRDYYIAKELNDAIMLIKIGTRTTQLITRAFYILNSE